MISLRPKSTNKREGSNHKGVTVLTDRVFCSMESLSRRFGTRDPFKLLEELGTRVGFTTDYRRLKGFCLIINRIIYVRINDMLPDAEKKIVAAHELGHVVLHRARLQHAYMMQDATLYYAKDTTELEANLFAADLLMTDASVMELAAESDADIFSMAKILRTMPELLTFKLRSMSSRGNDIPVPIRAPSNFLSK